MPVISSSIVPTIAPGNLFSSLIDQSSNLNIRWLTAYDPVYFEAVNRPLADIVLRQLILAKTLDQLSLSIGHQSMFPFLVQAKVANGTDIVDIPPGWIWDLNMSLPAKWENFRLAKIKRISGTNGTTTYTGSLRLIFTANQLGSTTEVAIFYVDYDIDSTLTYQRSRLIVIDGTEEATVIDPGESETVSGFITFRTLDQTDSTVINFYNLVDAISITDDNSDGYYDTPDEYDLVDTVAGGTDVTGDYATIVMSHGTGLLVDSTANPIPALDSDVQSWINSFNYPFDSEANLRSTGTASVTIPLGLFREFDITAPAGDSPTSDTTGLFFPVWINRIEAVSGTTEQIRVYFATHNISDITPSVSAVEFARLDLSSSMTSGQIVEIVPTDDLSEHTGSDDELYQQHFGRGHVVLSSLWGGTSNDVTDFFTSINDLGSITFTASSTRLSSFGISRVPKYIPTIGQSQALAGTSSNLDIPVYPSSDNKYVTEADQGLGNTIDLEADTDISPTSGIERYGYSGSLAHRIIKLCIDHTQIPTGSDTGASDFYEEHILPRLTLLYGRLPIFGDVWYDGTRFKTYNGDTWQG